MKFLSRLYSRLIVLAAISLCSQFCDAQKGHGQDLLKMAEKFDQEFLKAFNSGNVDEIMKFYWKSPELVLYGPSDMQVLGYDAAKVLFEREFTAYKGSRLAYTSVHNIVMDDCVIGHGLFTWTLPNGSDQPFIFQGRFTEVKAIKDGKMVIILDHVSMPAPNE